MRSNGKMKAKGPPWDLDEFKWLEADVAWLDGTDASTFLVGEVHSEYYAARARRNAEKNAFALKLDPRSTEPNQVRHTLAVYKRARSQKSGELIKAKKGLPLHQRLFLQALEANSYNLAQAHASLQRKGFAYAYGTVSNWRNHIRFKAALELSMALATDNITPNSILLNTQRVVDLALTPKPILYQGQDTGYREYDPSSALTGLKMLGENKKLWSDKTSTNVILDIELIDFSRPAQAPVTVDNDTQEIVDATR